MIRNDDSKRRTGRTLTILFVAWMLLMAVIAGLAKLAPSAIGKSDVAFAIFGLVFLALFVAAFIPGVQRMIAYIRWTGKYPYYFLFRGSGTSGSKGKNPSTDK